MDASPKQYRKTVLPSLHPFHSGQVKGVTGPAFGTSEKHSIRREQAAHWYHPPNVQIKGSAACMDVSKCCATRSTPFSLNKKQKDNCKQEGEYDSLVFLKNPRKLNSPLSLFSPDRSSVTKAPVYDRTVNGVLMVEQAVARNEDAS